MAIFKPVQITLKNDTVVTLRSATRWDARDYMKFKLETLATSQHLNTEVDEAQLSPSRERRDIVRVAASSNEVILLALHDKKIIGAIETVTDRRRRLQHSTLLALMVAKPYREQGLGRALLQTTLNWVQNKTGIERAELHVHATNTPAISLYKSSGFVEEGRRRNAIYLGHQEYVDDILMCAYFERTSLQAKGHVIWPVNS